MKHKKTKATLPYWITPKPEREVQVPVGAIYEPEFFNNLINSVYRLTHDPRVPKRLRVSGIRALCAKQSRRLADKGYLTPTQFKKLTDAYNQLNNATKQTC